MGSPEWHSFFSALHGRTDLDNGRRVGMSNERVIVQEYGMMVEASGSVAGRRVLDVGCGLGLLARTYAALGGMVSGIDYVDPTITQLAGIYPEVTWRVEDLSSPSDTLLSERFDVVSVCEVLQHVDARVVLPRLWSLLLPGGRLVGIVPNADCPIVQRVLASHSTYRAFRSREIREYLRDGPHVQGVWFRYASFAQDQAVAPYQLSPWFAEPESPCPAGNRIQFVAVRAK